MSTLFDEAEADAIVKAVMILHNKEVLIINKENKVMAVVLYKDVDGQIKQAVAFETITREEIQTHIDEANEQASIWQEALATYDRISGGLEITAAPTEPEAPVSESVPVEQPTPEVTPEAPAESLTDVPADTPAASDATPEVAPITVQ